MSTGEIRFEDGAAYERYMGKWSRLVGEEFLDWLAPSPGWRWLDVGCGNGAFTDLLVERCAPAAVSGVDPSAAQLAYARQRSRLTAAEFHVGDAMTLPFPDDQFDAAVMPLVISFVPNPARGVAEMSRVVRAAGVVSAYIWDMNGGGFPYATLHAEMRAMGIDVPKPPSNDVSGADVLHQLWTGAGLDAVTTGVITVERSFDSFDDYWTTVFGGPSVGRQLSAMRAPERDRLKSVMQAHYAPDSRGCITYSARANTIKGLVPIRNKRELV